MLSSRNYTRSLLRRHSCSGGDEIMNIAVILAGGVGSRVGADIPKQFININGKPVIAYTAERFQNNKNIDVIEVVVHNDWMDECKDIMSKYNIAKVKWYTEGGKNFQESVINGLKNLNGIASDEDILVFSYSVSPYTTDEIIDDNISVCQKYGNAMAAEDVVLNTCIKDDEFGTTQGLIRENLKGFSNPLSFKYGELRDAYEEATRLGILDKILPYPYFLYMELGKKVYFSKTNRKNFKITTKEDLDLFKGLILLEKSY